MATDPVLIIQAPAAGAVAVQLASDPPPSLSSGAAVLEIGPADADGNLEPPRAGDVVLSVPSPESFRRDPSEIRRALAGQTTGTEPLVIVVEAADELREDELSPVLDAARRGSRPVILRVIRDG
jgi:hypothetical protein